MKLKISSKKILLPILITILVFDVYGVKKILAQSSPSVLYVPLIGITSVPDPLTLPDKGGEVIYKYAVKNFLQEVALINIRVTDDVCSPIKFLEGDDDNDSRLDYDETWRYTCTTKIYETTESTATARGTANDITATHKARTTVIVGSNNPPPLISIINITKIAYPLSLPTEGGEITFTYRVNNPGIVPLSEVVVTDDKCSAISGKLGDTNGNKLLDTNEVWVYTCKTTLRQTTTNTVSVTAFANDLRAVGEATITVKVDSPGFPAQPIPSLPETGVDFDFKIIVWGILLGILGTLITFFFLTRKNNKQ